MYTLKSVCAFSSAKVVDLDPCLTKKPVEDSACHPYNTRGSMSEVHSLSSFQSESCDDNGMLVACWIYHCKEEKLTIQYNLRNAISDVILHLRWFIVFFLCDQPAGSCNSYLPCRALSIFMLTHSLCMLRMDDPMLALGHFFFSLSFCCGASAPIWIKSVHRSRTRF